MGSIEVQLSAPLYRLIGGHGHCLFPALRERGELAYSSAGFFSQEFTWGSLTRPERDECEPCCEDEGAQCDDEGVPSDNGIADTDGLGEAVPAAAYG